ncbi:MAG: NAD(P)-dependent oxidoreductase [Spirochaetes bacterium]|nr:NAD(P)-dependent oxidoreductase [Spirochaetota bacterium]
MKKAIVTGANGFIGSAFVEYLAKQDIQVLALGRKDLAEISESKRRKMQRAEYLKLNMNEISGLVDWVSATKWEVGKDCVFFHLAWGGETGLSDLNVAAQMENVYWSASALEVASRIGCSRFIQVGTMEEAFTEKYLELNHPKDHQYNRHVIYSVAKIAAKNALRLKAAQLGMDFIYVLHSHVMGPEDDKNSFLQVTLQKLIRGDELIFSSGEQYFDVISVNDCALGYYLICQKGLPGDVYWVGSGDPRPLREYVERMYALFPSGVEMQFGRLPYNDIVLDKEVFSISKLVDVTGYKPILTYEQIVTELHEYLIQMSSH